MFEQSGAGLFVFKYRVESAICLNGNSLIRTPYGRITFFCALPSHTTDFSDLVSSVHLAAACPAPFFFVALVTLAEHAPSLHSSMRFYFPTFEISLHAVGGASPPASRPQSDRFSCSHAL